VELRIPTQKPGCADQTGQGGIPQDELDLIGSDKGSADKVAKKTKGRFGFHRGGDKHEPPTAAYVQICVKSSTLSRAPDLAISGHLTTDTEIDEFVDDALVELEEIRVAARKALGQRGAR